MLDWPTETVMGQQQTGEAFHSVSNIVLDFHGDPSKAKLVVFSDGNHHMALLPAIQGIAVEAYSKEVFDHTVVCGRRIHHREAPEALASGIADVAIVYYHLALRYKRIFPELFDTVPLGGTKTHPQPYPQNRIAAIHMGLVGAGGAWGERFLAFMRSPTVSEIYAHHGLVE